MIIKELGGFGYGWDRNIREASALPKVFLTFIRDIINSLNQADTRDILMLKHLIKWFQGIISAVYISIDTVAAVWLILPTLVQTWPHVFALGTDANWWKDFSFEIATISFYAQRGSPRQVILPCRRRKKVIRTVPLNVGIVVMSLSPTTMRRLFPTRNILLLEDGGLLFPHMTGLPHMRAWSACVAIASFVQYDGRRGIAADVIICYLLIGILRCFNISTNSSIWVMSRGSLQKTALSLLYILIE